MTTRDKIRKEIKEELYKLKEFLITNKDMKNLMGFSRIEMKGKVIELINPEIKSCKIYIKGRQAELNLKEFTNKEWLKGRIEECEYTLEMLREIKQQIKKIK